MFARRMETGGMTFNLYIMRYKTLDSVVNEGSYYQPSKAVMTLDHLDIQRLDKLDIATIAGLSKFMTDNDVGQVRPQSWCGRPGPKRPQRYRARGIISDPGVTFCYFTYSVKGRGCIVSRRSVQMAE